MRGVIMHAARDIRVEDREVPHVIEPTDAVIKLEAACVCGITKIGRASCRERV